jgi:hypothetical protein
LSIKTFRCQNVGQNRDINTGNKPTERGNFKYLGTAMKEQKGKSPIN